MWTIISDLWIHNLLVFLLHGKDCFKVFCSISMWFSFVWKFILTLSWRRPLSYRNQSIDLICKSMDWFLHDNGLRHDRVNESSYFRIFQKKTETFLFLKYRNRMVIYHPRDWRKLTFGTSLYTLLEYIESLPQLDLK